RFLNETSVAAGIRRIEGTVGHAADELLRNEKEILNTLKKQLHSDELFDTIDKLLDENKQLAKSNEQLKQKQGSAALDQFINEAQRVDDSFQIITGEIEDADMDMLKQLCYESLEKQPEKTITILGAKDEQKNKVFIA